MSTSTAALSVRDVSVIRSGRRILDQISVDIPAGAVVGVVGPNGAGKSTLLGCLFRHVTPDEGHVAVDGRDVRSMSRRELARLIAAVPQDTPLAFDLSVSEIVGAGRIPHTRGLVASSEDQRIVDDCIQRVDLDHLRHRSISTLSGGERQRAFLGRALAQAASILILDEPTNHLDLANQEQLLRLVRSHDGTTVVAVHDLNLAAEYCDTVVVLAGGVVVTSGAPDDVITQDLLADIFHVDAHIVAHPDSGRPHIIVRTRPPAD